MSVSRIRIQRIRSSFSSYSFNTSRKPFTDTKNLAVDLPIFLYFTVQGNENLFRANNEKIQVHALLSVCRAEFLSLKFVGLHETKDVTGYKLKYVQISFSMAHVQFRHFDHMMTFS